MSAPRLVQNFRGCRAIVVGNSGAALGALETTLRRLGLTVELAESCVHIRMDALSSEQDILFVDGDAGDLCPLGPCGTGCPPAPVIGLVGVEAPSRLKALLQLGATALLRKPVHVSGVYSALYIGVNAYRAQVRMQGLLSENERRRRGRRAVVKAILMIMRANNVDDETAYEWLRRRSMASRQTLEDVCEHLVAEGQEEVGVDDRVAASFLKRGEQSC